MSGHLPAALAAELIPTGTFGGPRPVLPVPGRPVDPLAAQHLADLMRELDAHDADRRRAHLRLVGDDDLRESA